MRRGRQVLTDKDVAERGEALAELVHLGLVGLDLVAVLVDALALLLDVEAKVLEENNAAVVGLVDNLLDLGADRVGGEGHALAEELLELGDDGLQRVLGVDLAIGTAEVGHENDGLCAMVDGVPDGGDGADDALGVGDLVAVKGDVEVDLRGTQVRIYAGRGVGSRHHMLVHTRMRTRLPLRSTSSIESLLARDMLMAVRGNWERMDVKGTGL